MLDAMTPAQFRERMIADIIDPIDATWEQAGTIAATIHNEITKILSGLSGQRMTNDDIHTERHYQPTIRVEPKSKQPSSDDDLRSFVESAKVIAGS